MTLRSLFRNRGTALFAGLFLGGLLLSALPSAAPRQGDDRPPPPPPIQPLVPAFGTADSNGAMIAVTGMDITGASILYLVDTNTKHLAIYQASGGAESSQGVKLVGARRIDLDLQLDGYNDKSEYSVRDLERRFSEIGRDARSPK